MKISLSILFLIYINSCFSQNWSMIKNTVSPTIELKSEYDSVYRQPLSGLGWEDGVHISEDGLHLFCTYVPIDCCSCSLNKTIPNIFSSRYIR